MTLGELEKRIKEIKECLIHEFDWTEELLEEIPVSVCLEDVDGGYGAILKDIEVDSPPLQIFLTGQIDEKCRIILEDIDETEERN